MTRSPIHPLPRRVPQQRRSRERFELVLDAAETLLSRDGYDAFTTTNVAEAAGIPASAVYRWFTDKDDLARALTSRHNERLDIAVAAALEELDPPTLDGTVATIFDIYVDYYREHPSHVTLWFEGRIGRTTVREHTEQLSAGIARYVIDHGLLPASTTALDIQLNAEVADRVHEFAFRNNPRGDRQILERGLRIVQMAARELVVSSS